MLLQFGNWKLDTNDGEIIRYFIGAEEFQLYFNVNFWVSLRTDVTKAQNLQKNEKTSLSFAPAFEEKKWENSGLPISKRCDIDFIYPN